MAHIDYIVATWELPESEARVVVERLRSIVDARQGVPQRLYGAIGVKGKRGFVGEWNDGRILLASTGASANETAIHAFGTLTPEGRSIARLDLQTTATIDDADGFIVKAIPSRRYRATLYTTINGAGATLYVGAPKSDARLRIYNKTAESGRAPDDGRDYIRFEMQFRNAYADAAWSRYASGLGNQLLVDWVSRMVPDGYTPEWLSHWLGAYGTKFNEPFLEQDDDWVDRRKRWIERSVIPAIRKVLAVEPQYADVIQSLIAGIKDGSISEQELL